MLFGILVMYHAIYGQFAFELTIAVAVDVHEGDLLQGTLVHTLMGRSFIREVGHNCRQSFSIYLHVYILASLFSPLTLPSFH